MKTIGLSDEAYERLALAKRKGESFNDVVLRLTGASTLLSMAGSLQGEVGDALAAKIASNRESDRVDTQTRAKRFAL